MFPLGVEGAPAPQGDKGASAGSETNTGAEGAGIGSIILEKGKTTLKKRRFFLYVAPLPVRSVASYVAPLPRAPST